MKLREALQKISDEVGAKWQELPDGDPIRDFLIDIGYTACQALENPVRNCERFDTGDVKMDAQNAMEAILEEGVAGCRGIAEYCLPPVAERKWVSIR